MRIIEKSAFLTDKNNRSSAYHSQTVRTRVAEIISTVKEQGDSSLFTFTEQFDGVKLNELRVNEQEIAEARDVVGEDFIQALQEARRNITAFHESQKQPSWFMGEQNGVFLGQKITPLDRVGVYVPGGKAAYPSTVLMNVIPARLAGVPKISIVTPPQADGKINPYVLVAAYETGVDHIYKVGGAQAIAALAYGTESIAKVNKIVGPGNTYVAQAKKLVYGDVSIDMIAGPSEICVVADETANPQFAAADLLSQAEHDEAASAICITTSEEQGLTIQNEVNEQMNQLDRHDIIEKSLEKNGRIVVCKSLDEALELVNTIAPEHLQLMIKNPYDHLHMIRNAGAIFLGNYSPEALGDYFAGPNHTLPTNGTAAFASPLGVYDFVKKSSVIHYTENALSTASESIITLAEAEGLTAHANAIRVRKA
ncbi:histidinol dehydrogenase [Virgibacillus phasianinus]|uniref:Histidinol dehydrogenase n=1 Tax=Virgibacillus phasianinus TaxID=2017483 RepID=A0A220TZY7_9BACI|nr:histidinol dehydrogenase [Virgibacillus phasianinus]ASK61418.1 histidinol dehydrogenase [Virgibacillus phasianinus]